MNRYKINIDISDIFKDIFKFKIREYSEPFLIIFITADDPDDACHQILINLIKAILQKNNSMETRIFCRLIKKYIRIDKIIIL